jgi:hypothetical protein
LCRQIVILSTRKSLLKQNLPLRGKRLQKAYSRALRIRKKIHKVALGLTICKPNQKAPDAHLDGEGGGEERSSQTNRCEASLREATTSTTKSASFVEIEQHEAQLPVQDKGKKGNEDDESERGDTDEEDEEGGEEQKEQVEEEEGAMSTHRVEGSDDGKREASETPYIELEPIQKEERLLEDARGYRASDSARLAGGVNNAHNVLPTEDEAPIHSITVIPSCLPLIFLEAVVSPLLISTFEGKVVPRAKPVSSTLMIELEG